MPDAQLTGPQRIISCYVPCGRHSGPWFCLWIKPGMEIQAERALREKEYPVFVPRHEVRVSGSQTRIEPLFPRYGFFQPNEHGHWVPALYARGVAAVLRNVTGNPISVPSALVDALMNRSEPDGVIHLPVPRRVRKDDTVAVPSGSLAGHIGLCTRATKERVWLLLDVLGARREVQFSRSMVEVG